MLPFLHQKCKKYFLLDIIFLGIVFFLLVLGLVLSLLSHLWSGNVGLGSSLSLTIAAATPAPSLPFTDSVFTLHQNAIAWLDRPKSIFDFTDPAATYDNPGVRQLWFILLFIADSLVGILIVLAGYQILFAGLSTRYGEALETLPNLIFAAIGANISLLFASFWIDLNNLLCSLMLTQQNVPDHPMSLFTVLGVGLGLTIATIPLIVILTILVIILGVQMVARLGIILFLTVFLPVLFVLLANSRTQRFGQAGLAAYVTAVLVQFIQLTCVTVGEKVLLPFLTLNIGPAEGIAPLINIMAGIGLLWLTLRIPALLRQWALASIADSGNAARSLLVAGSVKLGAKLLHIK